MRIELTASIPMKGPVLFEKQFAVTNSVRQLIRGVLRKYPTVYTIYMNGLPLLAGNVKQI
jgi:hypothetical protein